MKKSRFLFLLLLLLFVFMGSGLINAESPKVYNIITNPGEDLSKEVNVNWHATIQGTYLEYTKESDTNYSSKIKINPSERYFVAPEDSRGNQLPSRYVMNATISDLEAGTKYKYRIVYEDTTSKDYFFTTASSGTFSFIHITDPQYASQSDAQIFNNLMSKAYEINPDIAFTYFTGDVVDKGGRNEQWLWFFEASNINRNIVATTTGNHEYYDDNGPGVWFEEFYDIHNNNPKNGAETALNTSYYFRYNDTLFVTINSEKKTMTDQVTWFEKVMEENTDVNFVIVGMHRSMYGSIYASDSVAVRSNWQKVFDKYGVDLVLSGHDHIYSRSKLVYGDHISDDPIYGTTYIIGGAGGKKFYNAVENEKYQKVIEYTSVANIITVSDNKIEISLINQAGEELDKFETPIYSRRNSEVDTSFNRDTFLSQVTVETNPQYPTSGIVSWPENAYGNVITVKAKVGYSTSDIFLYHPTFTSLKFSGLYKDRLNVIEVEFQFADGEKVTKEYIIDNTPEEPDITIFEALEMIKEAIVSDIKGVYLLEN